MHKHRLSAERFSEVPGEPSETYVTTSDDSSHLHGLALGLHAKGYKSIMIELNHMPYEPNTLPHPDWRWEGAMAGPDGFNGRAYIANVAQDPRGQLWVFTRAGRYRVHREEFARKTISSMFLQGLPLTLLPADN
jgi:hypothetical protein